MPHPRLYQRRKQTYPRQPVASEDLIHPTMVQVQPKRAASHSETSLHPSARTRATPSSPRSTAQHGNSYATNTWSFQDSQLIKKESALKKIDFKTLWAIIITGLKHRRPEGTKEKPSRTTTPAQRHKSAADRSKSSEKTALQHHHNHQMMWNWSTVGGRHKWSGLLQLSENEK